MKNYINKILGCAILAYCNNAGILWQRVSRNQTDKFCWF